jgi:hypothetical protein
LLLLAGCTDATDISLFIPYALFASDELSATSTGVCGFSPITQAQGFYKGSGLLELDPAINPTAEYELGLQVENYLDQTVISDSMGDPLEGPQRNDFNVNYAIVKYDDIDGNLDFVGPSTVYISGTIRTGGEQNAGAVIVQPVVGTGVVQQWLKKFNGPPFLSSEQVVLKVQIFGVLNSGEKTQTGVFLFPLTLCFDCGGISPTAPPGSGGCPGQTTAVPLGHGPCCAPQDFISTCVACGAEGEPCCDASRSGVTNPSCGVTTGPGTTSLTCTGKAASTTAELCPYVDQASLICVKPAA